MKKILISTLGCLLLMTSFAAGAVTFTFDDNVGDPTSGTYTPGSSFNFDLTLTFSNPPANVVGFSLWFEVDPDNNNIQNFLTITSRVLSTQEGASPFSEPNGSFFPDSFNQVQGNGNLANNIDLGGTAPRPPGQGLIESAPPGPYPLANVGFQIAPNTPNGTYTLLLATSNPKRSQVTEQSGTNPTFTYTSFPAPDMTYTFTVVPEPATWSLFALGGLGSFGISLLRARRRK